MSAFDEPDSTAMNMGDAFAMWCQSTVAREVSWTFAGQSCSSFVLKMLQTKQSRASAFLNGHALGVQRETAAGL
jgi:hypothetical protein